MSIMTEQQYRARVRYVIGPDGSPLTVADLPPKDTKRWVIRRKAEVVAAVRGGLLSLEEFFAAAYGVTEKSSADNNPRITGLDAARTSKWGVMQATGNMWTWGHDGDPDEPRASLFGGSWFSGGGAGSRFAVVGCWPGGSSDDLGARGRGDHLQLA